MTAVTEPLSSSTRPTPSECVAVALPPLPPVGTAPGTDTLPPLPIQPIDCWLDANERGRARRVDAQALRGVDLSRYPDTAPLATRLAELTGTTVDRIVVTAGADDAIDRICRALLDGTRSAIGTTPTFGMIARLASATGAKVRAVEWLDGALPVDRIAALADAGTAAIFVVSPNNPTGAVASVKSLRRLRTLVPQATLVVDLAYVAFADQDPTEQLRDDPGIVLVRSLSKSHALAGARVGWAECDAALATTLRRIGTPFAVASTSVGIALAALRDGLELEPDDRHAVRAARERLGATAMSVGGVATPSQGNFVFARFGSAGRAGWAADALAGLGIAVRRAPGGVDDALRITVTGDEDLDARARDGLRAALAPEALLLDLDGVIADVSGSYRAAIVATAASFGVTVTPAQVEAAKRAGDANNDWILSLRLIRAAGIETDLPTVIERFQSVYLGRGAAGGGLRSAERALVTRDWLRTLANRRPVAIVTGRPRDEAAWFLDRFGLGGVAATVVAMEDAPAKPDPAPIRLALGRLGVRTAWMVGDTVDDVVAARRATTDASVVPIGVRAPGADSASDGVLLRAGAARVLDRTVSLDSLLALGATGGLR